MQSVHHVSQQVLAVVVAVNLISSLAPAPSRAATESRHASQIASAPWQLPRLSGSLPGKSPGVASASLAISPDLGNFSRLRQPSNLHEKKRTVVPILATDPNKLTTPSLENKANAKHSQLANKMMASARPLAFIENKGQFDRRVKFQVSGHGQTLWLTDSGIVFDFLRAKSNQTDPAYSEAQARNSDSNSPRVVQDSRIQKLLTTDMDRRVIYQDFVGAGTSPAIEAKSIQQGVYNYLSGSDPSKWQTEVRGFSEIVYHDVWKGIDLRLYGKGPDLEQEFIVMPGADLARVRVGYEGIDSLKVDEDGSLLIQAGVGEMRESVPQIYQEIAGRRVSVEGHFKLLSKSSYTFEVAPHDAKYALVVDPTLLYSTFLGGSAGNSLYSGNREVATGIAVDTSGNAYVTGDTASTDFPTTAGAFETSTNPGRSSFITKLNPTGSSTIYSTYFSSSSVDVKTTSVAVDQSGNAYVAGNASSGFPTTPNAYSQSCNGSGFLTVLNASGSGLVYSSCFGNGVVTSSMVADGRGHAYVTGYTTDLGFPTTSNAYQPSYPGARRSGFVTVFDTTASGASSLAYSTYLGIPTKVDNFGPVFYGIAVDGFGKIYVTGVTFNGFPVTPGAFQTTFPSSSSASFIAKLDPSVSGSQSLIYATYLGGTGATETNAIAVDASGNAYVTGSTNGPGTFPITANAFQHATSLSGTSSFVTKLNAAGSGLVYSTFVSDHNFSVGQAIAVDSLGDAYIAGQVNGSTFPVTTDAFQSSYANPSNTDFADAFLTKLNPDGSALIYSSYLGGSGDDAATALAIDQTGDAYLAGHTSSANFPVTQHAFQPVMHGTGDAFVTKFPLGSTFRVLEFLPSSGGNTGNLTATISGGGFHAGVSVKLSGGGPEIVASPVTIEPNGLSIAATFNLKGAETGTRDVVVTNSDGSVITLRQAFTILAGGAPNIQIFKTATRAVPGRYVTYTIVVANPGNVDSGAIDLTEYLEPWFTFTSSIPVPTDLVQGTALWPISLLGTSATYSAFSQWGIPNVNAGSSKSVSYVVKLDGSYPVGDQIDGTACAVTPDKALCVANALVELTGAAATCASLTVPAAQILCAVGSGLIIGSRYTLCVHKCGSNTQSTIASLDPNDIVGLAGVGLPQWLSGQIPVSYTISFANESNAKVPAQKVIVTNPLSANLDVTTLALANISIPGLQVPIPATFVPAAGQNEVSVTVDLRPGQNLLVTIDAKLDPNSRVMTWTFGSIDPVTGQPPVNPQVGFLQPGADGSVSFTVKPKIGLPTGTSISDQGTIVFDTNPPMSTQVWTNSIDNSAPASRVSPLPAVVATNFTVHWSGSDSGSGIQYFTIFVSDDRGPFTAWQTNTTASSATFTGQVGHTYGFYSIARDLVGNVEAAKTAAEATTLVASGPQCASDVSGSTSVTRSGYSYSIVTKSYAQTVTLENTSSAAITGPISLVLDNLSSNAILSNASGSTSCASPLASPFLSVAGPLNPGASVSVVLQFNDPTKAGISYTTRVLAGTGQR
jgi:uncharacterized repeat protein (TIGR01451 family)